MFSLDIFKIERVLFLSLSPDSEVSDSSGLEKLLPKFQRTPDLNRHTST